MRLAVLFATFDGVESFYCGVGAITQYMLYACKELRLHLTRYYTHISMHLLYPAPPKEFPKSQLIHKRTMEICLRSSIFIKAIPICKDVANPFGDSQSWPSMCRHASRYIKELVTKNDVTVVIAQDTPFAGLASFLADVSSERLKLLWVAQSTGRIWTPSNGARDVHRDSWEKLAVLHANKQSNVFVGAISKFMHLHLEEEFGVSKDSIIPVSNGVSIGYLKEFDALPQEMIARNLEAYGIPRDQPLFLAFGRAQWYKGLDLSAKLGSILANYQIHPVVMALDDVTGSAEATNTSIATILRSHCEKYTFLSDYPPLLPRIIMQWRGCKYISVLSRREPFGLIPAEYRILGPADGILFVSSAGGLPEQMPLSQTRLILPLALLESQDGELYEYVKSILENGDPELDNMNAIEHTQERFDILTNLKDCIQVMLRA